MVIRRITWIKSTPESRGFYLTSSACTSFDELTMDGILVEGESQAMAISEAQYDDLTWGRGAHCFCNNTADGFAGGITFITGAISDVPADFNDQWEPRRGSIHRQNGCGSVNHGAMDMWALRVIGLSEDPLVRKGVVRPSGGGGHH